MFRPFNDHHQLKIEFYFNWWWSLNGRNMPCKFSFKCVVIFIKINLPSTTHWDWISSSVRIKHLSSAFLLKNNNHCRTSQPRIAMSHRIMVTKSRENDTRYYLSFATVSINFGGSCQGKSNDFHPTEHEKSEQTN